MGDIRLQLKVGDRVESMTGSDRGNRSEYQGEQASCRHRDRLHHPAKADLRSVMKQPKETNAGLRATCSSSPQGNSVAPGNQALKQLGKY
jgi:hypothetical protein